MTNLKKSLLGSVPAAVLLATPAYAQTSAAPDKAGQQKGVATDESASQSGIADIIVTAERVKSTTQKTPLAITTVDGRALERAAVIDMRDLNTLVPGLDIRTGSSAGSTFFIRGVGSNFNNGLGDPALSFSVDQLYYSRPFGPGYQLHDLERVEVLKGPQGTLYGRNATGGAINYVSRKPTFDAVSGEMSGELGSADLWKGTGALNVPLSETLAARASIVMVHRDGFNTDGYNDLKYNAARLHLLWRPSSDWSVLLTGNYAYDHSKGAGYVPYENNSFLTSNPYLGSSTPTIVNYVLSRAAAVRNLGNPGGSGPFVTRTDGYQHIKVASVQAEIVGNLGFAELTVLPAYLRTRADQKLYNNGSTSQMPTQSADQYSIETRLGGDIGRLRWITGIYYQNEKQRFDAFLEGTGASYRTFLSQPTRNTSAAAYAQGTYSLTDALRFTAGIRHTRESKDVHDLITTSLAQGLLPPPGWPQAPTVFPTGLSYTRVAENSQKFRATNYRLAVDWDVTPRNLLYASVATGFHAGGLNLGAPATRPLCVLPNITNCDFPASYEPERLTAYTIGSKNRFFDNKLQLNLELYRWDYVNLQVVHFGLVNPSVNTVRTDNAGKARIKGIDVDLSVNLTRRDTFTVLYNLNDAKYGDLQYPQVIGTNVSIVNLSGTSFLAVPRHTATASYQHRFELANDGAIEVGVKSRYSSRVTYQRAAPPGLTYDVVQSGFTRTDANLTYRAPGGRWELTAYVKNIEDKTVALSGASSPTTGRPWTLPSDPRTYGIIVKTQF